MGATLTHPRLQHLAHVDHGWRSERQATATRLHRHGALATRTARRRSAARGTLPCATRPRSRRDGAVCRLDRECPTRSCRSSTGSQAETTSASSARGARAGQDDRLRSIVKLAAGSALDDGKEMNLPPRKMIGTPIYMSCPEQIARGSATPRRRFCTRSASSLRAYYRTAGRRPAGHAAANDEQRA